MPVFPVDSTVHHNGLAIKQKHILLTPAFVLAEYKVQGSTFKSAVVDLKRTKHVKALQEIYKNFYSTYVQLSQLTTLEGVQLLEPITLFDVSYKPHSNLKFETIRLNWLLELILTLWQSQANI